MTEMLYGNKGVAHPKADQESGYAYRQNTAGSHRTGLEQAWRHSGVSARSSSDLHENPPLINGAWLASLNKSVEPGRVNAS
jgi:hypothetical protein